MRIYLDTDWSGRIDVTERVRLWRFRSRTPGGWWDAQITLDAPERDLWELINSWPGGTLTFHLQGQDVWSGRLAGARLQGGALQIDADGAARELLDGELWRVYADSGYADWDAAPDDERAFAVDNNNRLYAASNSGVIYASGDEGAISYPDDYLLGGEIVRFQATPEIIINYGSWIAELRTDDGTVVWSATASTTTAIDVSFAGTEGLTFALRATAAVGVNESDTETTRASARLTQITVRTLATAGTDTIVEDILDDQGITGTVESSGVDVDRAVYQRSTYLAALDDMANLGDGETSWVFVIYDDEAEFRAWASDADWMITRQDLGQWSLAWKLSDVANAVRAELPSGWRSDWYTDDDSIDYYKARREYTLRLRRTSQAEAQRLAQIYLADHAWSRAALRIATEMMVHKPDGSLFPAPYIRAGDVITLRGLIPDSDETIHVREVVVTANGVSITPVGAPNRLPVILAERSRER